jgi:hypothetical protein
MSKFLDRYLAGEHVAVWKELVALGEAIHQKRHYADAAAVAAETMRRARHNVEVLIERLDGQGFRFLTQEANDANQREAGRRVQEIHKQVFLGASRYLEGEAFLRSKERRQAYEAAAEHNRATAIAFTNKALVGKPAPLKNPEVLDRPTKQTAKKLDKMEELAGGPLPLSLRAWYEQVGGVSLIGWHSILSPNPDEPGALSGGATPDPLMIWPLDWVLKQLEMERNWKDEGEIKLDLAPDADFKAGGAGGGAYWMAIPDRRADNIFDDRSGSQRRGAPTLVNYLRNAFAWGGFPGWKRNSNPPREAIAKLTEGLLPL